jgi:hypothetical protein
VIAWKRHGRATTIASGILRAGERASWRPTIVAANQATRQFTLPTVFGGRLTVWPRIRISTLFFVDLSVDRRNFGDPPPPFVVLHIHDFRAAPVKVIRDEGYLLVQPIEGVA